MTSMGLDAHVLVIGGRRSGKSRFAEHLVRQTGLAPVYLATAVAGDEEMAERIAAHRARRGEEWETVEEPLALASAIARSGAPDRVVLVDCLTLWLANLMEAELDIDAETGSLIAALEAVSGPVVLVANEVGAGVIPNNALARRYSDAHGVLNQKAAAAVGRVILMTAGLPLQLKPSPQHQGLRP
jgi:adenosylcobinamide kinase / adenosylcobinamide-phosphate guanylyltransferase